MTYSPYEAPECQPVREPSLKDFKFVNPFDKKFRELGCIWDNLSPLSESQILWRSHLLFLLSLLGFLLSNWKIHNYSTTFGEMLIPGAVLSILAVLIYWPKSYLTVLTPLYAISQGVMIGIVSRVKFFHSSEQMQSIVLLNFAAVGLVSGLYHWDRSRNRPPNIRRMLLALMALIACYIPLVMWFIPESPTDFRVYTIAVALLSCAASVWAAMYHLTVYVSIKSWRVKPLAFFAAHQLNKALGAMLFIPWLAIVLIDIGSDFFKQRHKEGGFSAVEHMIWEWRRKRWGND